MAQQINVFAIQAQQEIHMKNVLLSKRKHAHHQPVEKVQNVENITETLNAHVQMVLMEIHTSVAPILMNVTQTMAVEKMLSV